MKAKPLVLIADDDRHIREALASRLLQADFDVVSTGSADGAMALFDRRQPDAAILDVRMPDADGFAVCEYIRKKGSEIPVFFLTGADKSIIRNHLATLTVAVGANHFVTKPYDGKTLALMLHDALKSKGRGITSEKPTCATRL